MIQPVDHNPWPLSTGLNQSWCDFYCNHDGKQIHDFVHVYTDLYSCMSSITCNPSIVVVPSVIGGFEQYTEKLSNPWPSGRGLNHS